MRKPVFVLAAMALLAGPLFAQTPPPQPQPQAPRPVARPAAPVPTPTVTIQVTDPSGLPLTGVQVTAQGPVARDGSTGEDGVVRFVNMRPGAYRLRFVREGSITLERDMTVRTGEPLLVDTFLSAAPVAPKPVEPARPAAAPASPGKPLGAPTDPKFTPIPTYLEKNFIGREGRKDSALGCTSTGSSTLVQLREALLNQTREDADEWIYIVAGEGTLRIGSSDQHVQAGTFSLIPHTVSYGILPGGKNPLIFVSVLSGRGCP